MMFQAGKVQKNQKNIALEFKLLNNSKDVESLNEEKARRYFALQLGELYTGLENFKTIY